MLKGLGVSVWLAEPKEGIEELYSCAISLVAGSDERCTWYQVRRRRRRVESDMHRLLRRQGTHSQCAQKGT